MSRVRSVILVAILAVVCLVALVLGNTKTVVSKIGLVDVDAKAFSLIDREEQENQTAENNAQQDSQASEADKQSSVNGTTGSIELTTKNVTVNTTGDMPKTGENDAPLFGAIALIGIAIASFVGYRKVNY